MIENSTDQSKTVKPFSGIPAAEFIEYVDEYMKRTPNLTAEIVIKRLDDLHSKYKYMESSLSTKKIRLNDQVPDIEKSLQLVQTLVDKKKNDSESSVRFLLADQCYTTATVLPTDKVFLWLGANVMLEYGLQDALELLNSNLSNAKTQLSKLQADLEFLKDQLTTTEVNMARVYNWDVQRRKAESQNNTG